ncbi:toxin-antitoxin system HicB family antitoxin [Xylanimonas protaetiae]|uniref:toxin-antitoxin system HicB family antitoxin n=1 Tax=Xylanimonas protaetiae TaxID=2509457 RepID=UPI0013E9CA2A|nr:toxin-antitoxin system HicB family antitoxin [Xylanimonas protaetiae]
MPNWLDTSLPSLSWLEPVSGAAFAGIQKLAHDVVEDLEANGDTVPVALSERTYSGEFRVRIPPQTHRRLVEKAAKEHDPLAGNAVTRLRMRELMATVTA